MTTETDAPAVKQRRRAWSRTRISDCLDLESQLHLASLSWILKVSKLKKVRSLVVAVCPTNGVGVNKVEATNVLPRLASGPRNSTNGL